MTPLIRAFLDAFRTARENAAYRRKERPRDRMDGVWILGGIDALPPPIVRQETDSTTRDKTLDKSFTAPVL